MSAYPRPFLLDADDPELDRRRADAIYNQLTGVGTTRDKSTYTEVHLRRVRPDEAERWARADGVAYRIASQVVADALRPGYKVRVSPKDASGSPQKPDKALSEQVEGRMRELDTGAASEGVRSQFAQVLTVARMVLGAALVPYVDDYRRLEEPLEPAKIGKIRRLKVFDARELTPLVYTPGRSDTGSGGLVEMWQLIERREAGYGDPYARIHSTRLARCHGDVTVEVPSTGQTLPGWPGDSCYARVVEYFGRWGSSVAATGTLLDDFAQMVYKIKGFNAARGKQDMYEKLLERARLVDTLRSVVRGIALDADSEDATRVTTSLAGYGEAQNILVVALAAASGYPITKLFGEAPAGLNATGEGDLNNYYDWVSSYEEHDAKPLLHRVATWCLGEAGRDPAGFQIEVEFNPLKQMSLTEQLDAKLKRAQIDQIEIQTQVVTPEEVAVSRYGGDDYDFETHIDQATLEQRQAEALGADPGVDPLTGLPATPEISAAAGGGAASVAASSPSSAADAPDVVADPALARPQPQVPAARADCDNVIRGEDGQLLGCKPGHGTESKSKESSSKESSGDAPKRETITPHPDDSPRVAKAKARRAQSRKENPDFDPARAEEYDHTTIKEAKQLDDAERRGLVKASGGTEKIEEIKQARVEAVAAEAGELHDAHAAAAAKLSELNRINSFGGDPLLDSAHVDGDDLELNDAANSFGTHEKGGLEIEGTPADYPDDEEEPEEPIEPDSIDFRKENEETGEVEIDEEAFASAKEQYKADKAAHKKALVEHKAKREAKKAEVLKKVDEVAASLEETHEKQLLAIEKLKAARAEARAKVKATFKEADADPEDLISDEVKARAKKADRYFEDGEEDDADLEEDEEVVRQRHQQARDDYDAAYSAAELLRDEAEVAKDDALDDDDVADKLEQLKNTARATKKQAAALRRVLKQKPKTYAKPVLPKAGDDEEDDEDEGGDED